MVDEWLADHGIDSASVSRSAAGDWISCKVPVSKAETMLGTKYNVFRNIETGHSIVRARSYSLPSLLERHVDDGPDDLNDLADDGRRGSGSHDCVLDMVKRQPCSADAPPTISAISCVICA